MAFCPSCGSKVGDNDKFCGSCGATRVPGAPAGQPPPPPQPPPPVYQAPPPQFQSAPPPMYNAPIGGYQQPGMQPMGGPQVAADTSGDSSTGLKANIAAIICYFGWWITGIIFLVIEKKSQFVRFHAAQSLVVFGAISILNFILNIVFNRMGVLGSLLSGVIWLASIALWAFLMYKAYQGQTYKVPIAGDIAQSVAGKVQI
jgi:uncharacterized membrane protein